MIPFFKNTFPLALHPDKVGTYSPIVNSGGGYFYNDVLEYRVWSKDEKGELTLQSFASYGDALDFSKHTSDAEEPLVLIHQEVYIDEPEQGKYVVVTRPRDTEWQVKWLKGSKYSEPKFSKFLQKHNINPNT